MSDEQFPNSVSNNSAREIAEVIRNKYGNYIAWEQIATIISRYIEQERNLTSKCSGRDKRGVDKNICLKLADRLFK